MNIALANIVAKPLGLVRNLLLVATLGMTGLVADSFNIGNSLPNLVFLYASAAIGSVLMPTIIALSRRSRSEEDISRLLTVTVSIVAVFTALLVAIAPLLVRLFTLSGVWDARAFSLAVIFAYWAIPQVFFYGLHSIVGQLLNARNQFAVAEWAIAANSVFCIIGLSAFLVAFGGGSGDLDFLLNWSTERTVFIMVVITGGTIVQAMIPLIALRNGGFHWKLNYGFRGLGFRRASKLMAWTLLANSLILAFEIFQRNVTSAAGQLGAVSGTPTAGNATLYNVSTVINIPLALLVWPILTALFPRMVSAAIEGDTANFRYEISKAIRYCALLTTLVSVFLFVFAANVLQILFPSLNDIELMTATAVLRYFSIGIVPNGFSLIMLRSFFALNDGKGVFLFNLWQALTNISVMYVISRVVSFHYWVSGAAFAWSVGSCVTAIFGYWRIRSRVGKLDPARMPNLVKTVAIAGVPSALVALIIDRFLGSLNGYASWSNSIITVIVGFAAMSAVYAAFLRWRNCEDFYRLSKVALNRLPGRKV